MGSMVTASGGTILTHAGPEIGVASTKAFTSQLTALLLLAAQLARFEGSYFGRSGKKSPAGVHRIPHKIEIALQAMRRGFTRI